MIFDEIKFRKDLLSRLNFDEEFFLAIVDESPLVTIMYIYYLIKENKNEKALEIYKTLQPREEFKSYYILIDALFEKDSKLKLQKLYNSLSLKKDNLWTLIELYYILKNTEESYKAFGYLEEAIKYENDFYEARYEKVLNLNSVDNCDVIIQEIITFPETYIDENILNTLAFAFFNCYNIENAEKIINESLKIKETKEAFFLLGMIYFDKYDDKTNALNYYNKSLELDSNQPEVLTEKGWLLFEIGKINEAEEVFLKSITIKSCDETFNQAIHFYFTIKKFEKAYEFLKISKNRFGNNYSNDGYEILYFTLLKNNEIAQRLASDFKIKYSSFEIEWLKSIISEFGNE